MGIQTEFLETDQLHDEIQYLVDLLISLDVQQVLVLYGVGCTTEQLYDPIPVPVSDLATFIQASIDHGIFHLGDDDLYVEAVTPPCQFLLCHEHDLHLESEVPIRSYCARLKRHGYTEDIRSCQVQTPDRRIHGRCAAEKALQAMPVNVAKIRTA